MRRWVIAIGISAGCYSPAVAPGVPCSENGSCPEGQSCVGGVCQLLGTGDATIDVMGDAHAIIDACPAAACQGDDVVGCGTPVTCDTGCSDDGGAHCRQLVPSLGLTPAMLAGVTADVTGENWSFNTESGQIKHGNNVLRVTGTGVISGIRFEVVDGMGVFTARSFTVGPTGNFGGEGGNTLVLYASTTITVVGDFDIGASGATAGPGGSIGTSLMSGTNCRGRAGRFFAAGYGEGGGGGGGRTAGGNGGASNMGASAGLGGTVCTTLPATTPVLRGGAGGGHGGASSSNAGGGGGGGLALVAMESILVSGTIGAPGEGGQSGSGPAPSGDGGGGGGGGGAVLLEAPFVTITGEVTANGGGGGGPRTGDGNRGSMTSASTASGGSYAGPGGTVTGGRGGAGLLGPTNGATYTESDATPVVIIVRGSGGGGAAGRVEIKSLMRTTTGSTLSPTPQFTDATLE